ncbi:NACHT, LRR and PYD domains-containing protein 3-like, partial [Leucoraja erinacea]|uniref:NACHT, LRR and PYD domains-containing protein 3-like n=1 Tax=Leucoraja erinaceus TaxID=7782 RepID=UPI0024554992
CGDLHWFLSPRILHPYSEFLQQFCVPSPLLCLITRLGGNGLTESCAEDLATALNASIFLTELYVGTNKLGDSGVKAMCPALSNPGCKIQKLWLWGNGLPDSCTEDLVAALSAKCSVTDVELGSNSFSERSVPALCRLTLALPSLQWIGFWGNQFSSNGAKQLQGCRPKLTVAI